MRERVHEVFRARPGSKARGSIDVTCIAQIDERAAQMPCQLARVGKRHPRVGLAADQNGRHAKTACVECTRKLELLRAGRRDEQHARYIGNWHALLQRMHGGEAPEAMRRKHKRPALAGQYLTVLLR